MLMQVRQPKNAVEVAQVLHELICYCYRYHTYFPVRNNECLSFAIASDITIELLQRLYRYKQNLIVRVSWMLQS